MEPRPGLHERHPLLLALGLLVLAVAVRAPALSRGLWLDECFSCAMAAESPAELPQVVRERDTHPPGYYLALHAWLSLAPSDRDSADLAARGFSLLCGLLHVLVLGFVAARILGARAGWVAAALAAVSSEMAWPSTEVRSFALAALLLSVAWLLALEALERGRLWCYALAALALAAAGWTFYYAALGAVALFAFVLALKPPARHVAGLAVAGLAAGLTLVPWLPSLKQQMAWVLDKTDAGHAGLSLDASGLLDRWLNHHVLASGPWFWLGGLLALPPLLIAWKRRHAWGWRWQPAPGEKPRALKALTWMVVAYLVAVLVVGLMGSFVGRRYATFLAGIWCVLTAAFHARLSPRIQGWVLAALLVGGAAGTFARSLRENHPDWRVATAWVTAHASPGDIVGVEPSFHILCWRHYAEAKSPPALGLPGELPGLEGGAAARRAAAYVEPRHAASLRAWLNALTDPGPPPNPFDESEAPFTGPSPPNVMWLMRVAGRSRPHEDSLRAALSETGWSFRSAHLFHGLFVERWEGPIRWSPPR